MTMSLSGSASGWPAARDIFPSWYVCWHGHFHSSAPPVPCLVSMCDTSQVVRCGVGAGGAMLLSNRPDAGTCTDAPTPSSPEFDLAGQSACARLSLAIPPAQSPLVSSAQQSCSVPDGRPKGHTVLARKGLPIPEVMSILP